MGPLCPISAFGRREDFLDREVQTACCILPKLIGASSHLVPYMHGGERKREREREEREREREKRERKSE